MNQVLRHILASYKLYFELVLAYKKLVIRTTQQHLEQTLIIIHAVLSDRFNLSTRASIYIPLRFAIFRRFFWRTYRNWFFFMRRVFQDRKWSLRLFQPRLLGRRVVWLPRENLTLNRALDLPISITPLRVRRWNVIAVTNVGVTSRAGC